MKAETYNRNLERIMQPEIDRLKLCEGIASEILRDLNKRVNIDTCGLPDWFLVNIVSSVIRKNYYKIKEDVK
ncbi:MAG: hypothetical protein IPJ03_16830 [Ignavibacteriales bacterium]|nr:hypothetical protein [Ignavibacteriales bacterium]